MILNTITVLNDKLNIINNHLEVLKRIENVVKPQTNDGDINYIKSQNTQEKIFNYRANIISLYGAFEYFIEEVFKEYVGCLRIVVPSFSDLNDKIKDSYFINVAKLHEKLHYAKFSHLSELIIAQNIEQVIVQNRNEILAESYLGNGGNYKYGVINDLMNSIGITDVGGKIIKFKPLSDFLSEETIDMQLQMEKVRIIIDNFVDRRNEVAHGASTDNIVDIHSFADMVDFIGLYCTSLHNLLDHELMSCMWENPSINTYSPINVYDNKIVELRVKNLKVSIGSKVLIKKHTFPYFEEAEIIGLRVKQCGKILPKEMTYVYEIEQQISIEISNKIKTNYKLKFI